MPLKGKFQEKFNCTKEEMQKKLEESLKTSEDEDISRLKKEMLRCRKEV